MICHKFVIRRKNEIVLIIDLWNTKLIFVAKFSARDNHEVFHPGERILDIRCTHGAPVHNRARQNGVLQFALAIYNSRIQLLN